MLGFNRRAASYTFTAAMVLLLLYLVYLVRSTLFVFVLALLFAYLLSPLVNLLDRFLPGRTRTPALALAYVIFVGLRRFPGHSDRRDRRGAGYVLDKKFPDMLASWQQPTPGATPGVNSLKDDLVGKLRAGGGEALQRSGFAPAAIRPEVPDCGQRRDLPRDHPDSGVLLPEGRACHAGAYPRYCRSRPAPRTAG